MPGGKADENGVGVPGTPEIYLYIQINLLSLYGKQQQGLKTTACKYHQCLYFTSNALARKVEKLAQESWKKVRLSPSHAYLLMMVIENPGIQPGRIGEELQLTPSTISRLLEKLEERKLLVRIADGKQTNVYPAPAGKALLPTLKDCLLDFYQKYSTILGSDESARLVRDMGTVADRL